MPLRVGRHEATIESHCLRIVADKEVVSLQCHLDGDEETFEVLIWMTEKSFPIARRQLQLCGFNVDTMDLWMLQDRQTLLSSNKINVLVEDWKGNLRAQVFLQSEPTQKRIKELEAGLRNARGDDDGDLPF